MCVYVRNRRRRRDRNKVCVLSCQTARFHCHHHAFPNDGMFDSVSAMLLYLSSLFLSHRSLYWGIRHCLSPWSATLVCYSFTFPFCRACVQDFFIFLFLYHPPAPPRLVPSCTHVFLTQVSLGTDECAGFREGCGFQKMSDWYSRYSQSRCQLLLIYCFQPRAVLLNRRLTNRPFHYLSLSLTGRESRVQMPRCLSARWLVVVFFFFFSFSHFSHEDPCLMPPVFFLFSFVFFPPKVKIKK